MLTVFGRLETWLAMALFWNMLAEKPFKRGNGDTYLFELLFIVEDMIARASPKIQIKLVWNTIQAIQNESQLVTFGRKACLRSSGRLFEKRPVSSFSRASSFSSNWLSLGSFSCRSRSESLLFSPCKRANCAVQCLSLPTLRTNSNEKFWLYSKNRKNNKRKKNLIYKFFNIGFFGWIEIFLVLHFLMQFVFSIQFLFDLKKAKKWDVVK